MRVTWECLAVAVVRKVFNSHPQNKEELERTLNRWKKMDGWMDIITFVLICLEPVILKNVRKALHVSGSRFLELEHGCQTQIR